MLYKGRNNVAIFFDDYTSMVFKAKDKRFMEKDSQSYYLSKFFKYYQ